MKKRIISMLLALAMVFGMIPDLGLTANAATITASGTCGDNGDNVTWVLDSTGTLTIEGTGGETCPTVDFSDLNEIAWYHDGVHYVIEKGLMNGIGGGRFDPNGTTSRAMIVTILWRLEGQPVVNYLMGFEDVAAERWYTEAIRWAVSEGIVTGYSDLTFGPNDAITREQLATILWRYAQYKGYDVSVGEDTNILSYDDAFDISEYAIPAMQWACGAGVMNGRTASTLAPGGSATRAEAATILWRMME